MEKYPDGILSLWNGINMIDMPSEQYPNGIKFSRNNTPMEWYPHEISGQCIHMQYFLFRIKVKVSLFNVGSFMEYYYDRISFLCISILMELYTNGKVSRWNTIIME